MAEWHANFISVFGYRISETNCTIGRTNSNDSVVNVQVISILLYSFSWLWLKTRTLYNTVQCSEIIKGIYMLQFIQICRGEEKLATCLTKSFLQTFFLFIPFGIF
jgi:hypothetical protein